MADEVRTLKFIVEIDTYGGPKHDNSKLRTLCNALYLQFPIWRVYDEQGRQVRYEGLAHGGRGAVEVVEPDKTPKRRFWRA
jgi:hypothetical protein